MSKATPRPWKFNIRHATDYITEDNHLQTCILQIDDLCGDSEKKNANAELIVRAVNCHDELVDFLSIQVENTRGLSLMNPKNNDLRLRLLKEEDLLKRAKGE